MGKAMQVWRTKGPAGFARWVLLKRIGKPLFRGLDSFFGRQSLVGDPDVFDPRVFPFAGALEADWKTVRRELDALLAERQQIPAIRDIQPDQEKTAIDDGWRSFVLLGYGTASELGYARCPETVRLLEHVPGLTTAFFSVLTPGTRIPRHAGVTKAVVRCHLALKVPTAAQDCRMQVAEELVVWQEGHCVFFDDSAKHEVWNDTQEERVVLIIDFHRPMRRAGKIVGLALYHLFRMSPFVRSARRNQRAFERELAAAAAVTAA